VKFLYVLLNGLKEILGKRSCSLVLTQVRILSLTFMLSKIALILKTEFLTKFLLIIQVRITSISNGVEVPKNFSEKFFRTVPHINILLEIICYVTLFLTKFLVF